MPESLPNPSPSQGQGSAPGAPLIDPNALVATFVAVLKAPVEFFKSTREEKGFKKCLVFSVAMMVVYGVLAAAALVMVGLGGGWAVRTFVRAVVFGFIGPFVGGAVLWMVCMVLAGKAPYEFSARIVAYSTAVAPVAGACLLVPYIGRLGAFLAVLYGLYIVVMGAKTLNFEPPPTAAPPAPPA